MSTLLTAAVAGAAYAALYTGHHVGDHVVQLHTDGLRKGMPGADQLATGTHPYTGWASCLRHVLTYLATQAAALGLVALVAPIGWAGAAAALTASGSTHAVIDRRWPVRLLIAVKGCDSWAQAPYYLGQSLHTAVLLVAAVLTAAVTGPAGVAGTAAAGAVLVAAALLAERRIAATARTRPYDPTRM